MKKYAIEVNFYTWRSIHTNALLFLYILAHWKNWNEFLNDFSGKKTGKYHEIPNLNFFEREEGKTVCSCNISPTKAI